MSAPSFDAQFPGECWECTGPIVPGERIERVPGKSGCYQHVHCPESYDVFAASRESLREPRCPRCGLNHPGEC